MRSDLLVRLLNLPRSARRALAVFLSVCALSVLAALIVIPLSILQTARSELFENRVELGRLEQILTVSGQETSPPPVALRNVFMDGQNEGSVQASLQRLLTALVGQNRRNIAAIGPAPSFEQDGITYVGITANVAGTHREISALFLQLETSDPPLLVRSARLTARQGPQANAGNEAVRLTVQLEIFGAIDPQEPV